MVFDDFIDKNCVPKQALAQINTKIIGGHEF